MTHWTTQEKDAVIKALAVVCELTQTVYSDAAQKVVLAQLSGYPSAQVLKSLERCAAECKYKLTLADVIQRLEDGRPGPEEAWALFPKSEAEAGCVTEEMSVAWGAAASLYETDEVGARMAFREAYTRELRNARAQGTPPRWRLSPGHDKALTEAAAAEGLRKGLLSPAAALEYVLPENRGKALLAAGLPVPKLLVTGQGAAVAYVKRQVAMVLGALEGETPLAPEKPIKPDVRNPVPPNERGERP